jgi:hypothetical protein
MALAMQSTCAHWKDPSLYSIGLASIFFVKQTSPQFDMVKGSASCGSEGWSQRMHKPVEVCDQLGDNDRFM